MSGTGPSADGVPEASTKPASPEALEADVARQRAELAATVDQLHARLDVKTRATERARALKDRATTDSGRPRTEVIAAAAAVVVAVGGLVALSVWRRRR